MINIFKQIDNSLEYNNYNVFLIEFISYAQALFMKYILLIME